MRSAEMEAVVNELERNRKEAETLYSVLQATGVPPVRGERWDATQHFEHLALFNRVYLSAMRTAAEEGHRAGQVRRKAMRPGVLGGLFLRMTEPPVRRWTRWQSPVVVKPQAMPLEKCFEDFLASHGSVVVFCEEYGELDLAGIRFVNPLVKGMNFNLFTCLRLVAAHERRHFWEIGQMQPDS